MLQGKSLVCRYLVEHHKAYMTGGGARLQDAMDGFDILTYDNIILFHYARAETEFCYEAMEIFKDGMGFSRKGKSKMKKWGMTHMRGCQWHTASAVQCEHRQATYPPPPTIPYTFLDPLGPLVGAVSGMTTSEAQRPHPGRMRRLRAVGVMGISVSAAPWGMPSQT